MQFKMSQNSLFAILLRSSWWVSFLTAAGIALLGRILFHGDYFSYAVALTLPFIVIGFIAAWRQKDVPGATRIAETVEAVSAMSWRANGTVDFVLEKEGRTSVVCCKRWKAQSQGIEPLRELEAAREAREAREALYVSVVELSESAWQFAKDNRIAVMRAPQLTRLLRLPRKPLARN